MVLFGNSFLMGTQEILNILKDQKKILSKEFHVQKIGLFGSYAGNLQHDGSDIDLVYVLYKGQKLGFLELESFEDYMKEILKTSQIDLVNQDYLNPLVQHHMQNKVVYV